MPVAGAVALAQLLGVAVAQGQKLGEGEVRALALAEGEAVGEVLCVGLRLSPCEGVPVAVAVALAVPRRAVMEADALGRLGSGLPDALALARALALMLALARALLLVLVLLLTLGETEDEGGALAVTLARAEDRGEGEEKSLRRTRTEEPLAMAEKEAAPLTEGQAVLLEVAVTTEGVAEGVALAAEESLGEALGFREALALPVRRAEEEAAPLALEKAVGDIVGSAGLGVADALREDSSVAVAGGEALKLGLALELVLERGLCESRSCVDVARDDSAAETEGEGEGEREASAEVEGLGEGELQGDGSSEREGSAEIVEVGEEEGAEGVSVLAAGVGVVGTVAVPEGCSEAVTGAEAQKDGSGEGVPEGEIDVAALGEKISLAEEEGVGAEGVGHLEAVGEGEC